MSRHPHASMRIEIINYSQSLPTTQNTSTIQQTSKYLIQIASEEQFSMSLIFVPEPVRMDSTPVESSLLDTAESLSSLNSIESYPSPCNKKMPKRRDATNLKNLIS